MSKASVKNQSTPLVRASARHLRIAPRKMRLVTNMVKQMNVGQAIVQLQHTAKKGAPIVIKLLKSAVANAQNNFSLDPDYLFIKSITTDMGKAMKRYFPRARGSAFVIQRKLAHVNVVLEERKKGKALKSRVNLFKKKEDKVATDNVDQKDATSKKLVKEEGSKSQIFKPEQKLKENRSQQKRRLFDRRAGE